MFCTADPCISLPTCLKRLPSRDFTRRNDSSRTRNPFARKNTTCEDTPLTFENPRAHPDIRKFTCPSLEFRLSVAVPRTRQSTLQYIATVASSSLNDESPATLAHVDGGLGLKIQSTCRGCPGHHTYEGLDFSAFHELTGQFSLASLSRLLCRRMSASVPIATQELWLLQNRLKLGFPSDGCTSEATHGCSCIPQICCIFIMSSLASGARLSAVAQEARGSSTPDGAEGSRQCGQGVSAESNQSPRSVRFVNANRRLTPAFQHEPIRTPCLQRIEPDPAIGRCCDVLGIQLRSQTEAEDHGRQRARSDVRQAQRHR